MKNRRSVKNCKVPNSNSTTTSKDKKQNGKSLPIQEHIKGQLRYEKLGAKREDC